MTNIKPILALLSEGTIDTEYGQFKISVFHDGNEQAITLSKGVLIGQERVLCRIHSECITSHVFFAKECDCRNQMVKAQKLVQDNGHGLIIFLKQEGRGSGAAAHVSTLDLKRKGISQYEAYNLVGFPADARRYDIAAKIIHYFQIKSVILISTNTKKIASLRDLNIEVCDTIDFTGEVTEIGTITDTITGYQNIGIHNSINKNKHKKWVFVIGDLNVDYLISEINLHDSILDKGPPIAGGTALNAAKAFKQKGFEPIIFGKIGNDNDGRFIRRELEKNRITSLVGITDEKPTGSCVVIYFNNENQRCIIKEDVNNANDYDLNNLQCALNFAKICKRDIILFVGHPFVRLGIEHTKKLINLIADKKSKIILDIVPHNMYDVLTIDEFNDVIRDNVDVLIGEYKTYQKLIGVNMVREKPNNEDINMFFKYFNSRILVVRYGIGNISIQSIYKRINSTHYKTIEEADTGYATATENVKRGFGDLLTADFLYRFQSEF